MSRLQSIQNIIDKLTQIYGEQGKSVVIKQIGDNSIIITNPSSDECITFSINVDTEFGTFKSFIHILKVNNCGTASGTDNIRNLIEVCKILRFPKITLDDLSFIT